MGAALESKSVKAEDVGTNISGDETGAVICHTPDFHFCSTVLGNVAVRNKNRWPPKTKMIYVLGFSGQNLRWSVAIC